MNAPSESALRGRPAGVLDSPVVGMAPWIIFSVLVGPGRFEVAVGLALATALVVVVAGRIVRPGASLKILELSDVVFFGLLAVIGAVASDGTSRWLETYAGEISNLALAAIAFGSMAVGVPFTIQYARERVDRAYWNTPQFLSTNYAITGAWGLAFLVAAIAGGYGDLVLHNPNNLWTGWIIQILAIIAAVRFTEWYPERVRAKVRGGPRRSLSSLLLPMAGLLVPLGVAVLIFDDAGVWLGVGLIVVGVVATKALSNNEKRDSAGRATR
ncbi:hypothetical protein ABZ070_19455 [Streptomyces sp. NPDC006283]|uniref:hypothetical protein n=1 Tax=Streptomyces sp. NPDC006283 TaxID=3156741 RepID=UPI0033A539B0